MNSFLAFKGGGGGDLFGPTGLLIVAAIFLIACAFHIGCVFKPAWRIGMRWGKGGRGGQVSALSCAAWAFSLGA